MGGKDRPAKKSGSNKASDGFYYYIGWYYWTAKTKIMNSDALKKAEETELAINVTPIGKNPHNGKSILKTTTFPNMESWQSI